MRNRGLRLAAVPLLLLSSSVGVTAPAEPARNEWVNDSDMQRSLNRIVESLELGQPAQQHRLAISLVDVTDIRNPRYAAVNDHDMMYAASLPKIAILLAGFERIRQGLMPYTAEVKEMFTRIARVSSNTDSSRAIQAIGFDYIAKVLTSTKYKLYDLAHNGGLWIGKAYGGPNDYWQRDPLHNLSHGATAFQVARFFLMLEQGRLVNPQYSAEIKEILSKPAIQHKFVKGLQSRPGAQIYRKSGTWKDAHCDAALIEYGDRKYIAVALMKDQRGGEVLPRLIQKLDDLIQHRSATAESITD